MKKVILYIATSLDDFIADKDGGVGWLPAGPESTGAADGSSHDYKTLLKRVDTIIMGRNSYLQVLGFGDWAWTDQHTYVLTSQALEASLPCITITKDSPRQLMDKLLKDSKPDIKDIWLLGGGQLVRSFAKEGLIDEILLSIMPKALGEGIPLGLSYDEFDLKSEETLTNGIVQKTYSKKIC